MFEVTEPQVSIYSLLAIAKDANPVAVIHGATTHQALPGEAGLQGLGRNLSRINYDVDYHKPYVDICKEFISFSIQQNHQTDDTRALDIICRPWAPMPRKEERMPSWIPKLKGAAFAMFPHTNGEVEIGGKNADPLVGLQNQIHCNAAESKQNQYVRILVQS